MTLTSRFRAFDDCECWTVVSRKKKKSSFYRKNRKQSFCGEPRGSERPFFQECCPGPGSASKASDSGPSLSFSQGILGSFSESQLDILNDPAVKALARLPRIRERRGPAYPPLCHRRIGADFSTVPAANEIAGESEEINCLLEVDTVSATKATAGDSERITGLLEVPQLAEVGGTAETAAHATAGDSEGIIGLHVSQSSFRMPINSLNSSGCVAAVACARVPAVPGLSATASSSAFPPASLPVVAHARSTPMHVAHNSWSDTVRLQGPTGKKRVKDGVSGRVEDLRPVSEVEAGVIFRPAGSVRGQDAGSLPRRQPGAGTRQRRVGAVTPSLHPEVLDTRFVSSGRGLGISQSMVGRRCVKPHCRGFGC